MKNHALSIDSFFSHTVTFDTTPTRILNRDRGSKIGDRAKATRRQKGQQQSSAKPAASQQQHSHGGSRC